MAELLGDHLERYAGGEGEAGCGVPEVVQADGRQVGLADQPLEGGGDHVRVQLGPILAGEHEPGVLPGGAPLLALGGLGRPPGLQGEGRSGVEGDGALAAVGLGLADLGGPAELDDLLGDAQDPSRKIRVLPTQADGFPAAQAAVRDEVEHRVEPVARRPVEEGAGLLRGPHGDARPDAGALPLEDAVIGPDDGSGAPAAGQLDVRGRVVTDQPAPHGAVEGRHERGVHATDACCRQRPVQRRLPGGGEPAELVGRLGVRSPELGHRGIQALDLDLAQLRQP